MSRLFLCAVLLLTNIASLAQQKAQIALALDGPVTPEEFVIQITGACQTKPGDFAVRDCVRGVTRQEFEQLLSIAAPNANEQVKQKFAQALGEIIILSNEAKKRDLPKDPAVKETLRFSQMQNLATLLVSQSLKKDADNISQADLESYYNTHLADYQTAEFQKILVPQAVAETTEERTKFAEGLSSRCAAGEDPAKLQAEADTAAKRAPTKLLELKNQRRSLFPAQEQPIFELKPGQCSAVYPERGDFAIFKLVAQTATPLAEARESIAKTLESTRVKDELAKIKSQNVISLNDRYFINLPPPAPAAPKK